MYHYFECEWKYIIINLPMSTLVFQLFYIVDILYILGAILLFEASSPLPVPTDEEIENHKQQREKSYQEQVHCNIMINITDVVQ